MNRNRFAVLLVAALAVAAIIGLADPADAHHNDVVGSAACQPNGTTLVTWTITNSESDKAETATLTGALTGTHPIAAGGVLTLTQTVLGTQTGSLTLNVHGAWSNEQTNDASGSVELPGDCPQPPEEPPLSPPVVETDHPVPTAGFTG